MGDYVLVTTTDTDADGMVDAGNINGGFTRRRREPRTTSPVVIAVDDI
jgi:hypothetical protein